MFTKIFEDWSLLKKGSKKNCEERFLQEIFESKIHPKIFKERSLPQKPEKEYIQKFTGEKFSNKKLWRQISTQKKFKKKLYQTLSQEKFLPKKNKKRLYQKTAKQIYQQISAEKSLPTMGHSQQNNIKESFHQTSLKKYSLPKNLKISSRL